MKGMGQGSDRPMMKRLSKILTILIIISALFNVIVLVVRIYSVTEEGRWGETTGMEWVALNIIYNVRKGLPCYHDINQNASVIVYNWGFYSIYGWVARVMNVSDNQFINLPRLLTLGCAVVGWAAMALWIRRRIAHWKESKIMQTVAAFAVSTNIWFGPFVGWWCLSARPDIPMAAAEVAGLSLARLAMRGRNTLLYICTAALFALAWSFKQNAIFVCLGVLLTVLLLGEWRFLLAGGLTFASVLIVTFAVAGPFYMEHVIWLPIIFERSLVAIARGVQSGFLTGFYVFVPVVFVAGMLFLRGEREELGLIVPWCISGLGSILFISAEGSSRNYLLSFYFIGGMVIVEEAGKFIKSEIRVRQGRVLMVALCILIALEGILAFSYLAYPNGFGRISVPVFTGSNPERFRLYLSEAKPIFIENAFDALPWNSGQTPSECIDTHFYLLLVRKGVLKETIEDRARRGYYAAAFVSSKSFVKAFKSGQYECVSVSADGVWQFRRNMERTSNRK